MGYTHYYRVSAEYAQVDWNLLVKDFTEVLGWKTSEVVYDEDHIESPPEDCIYIRDLLDEHPDSSQCLKVDGREIILNGREKNDEGHETFHLKRKFSQKDLKYHNQFERSSKRTLHFTCTKTARKPYDIVVCCCLLLARKYLGDKIQVSSDGDIEEWKTAIDLIEKKFGYKTIFITRRNDGTEPVIEPDDDNQFRVN